MLEAMATATEIQNDFERYLNMVLNGCAVIVTKNGEEIGRFVPKDTVISYLTDSLTGVLRGGSIASAREEALRAKYEITH